MRRRVYGVQPSDVGPQLADLGDQSFGLSHGTSISMADEKRSASARLLILTGKEVTTAEQHDGGATVRSGEIISPTST